MTEDAMRAMHQQFMATLEGLPRQNVELLNELGQQAANELAALRPDVRGAPLRRTQATGVGVDTRLLGKPSDFSGVQDAWRHWSTVFQGVRWRSDTTSAVADGRCHEGDRAAPERHDH